MTTKDDETKAGDKPVTPYSLSHAADASEISVAALLGLCSGYAAKKISKGVALAIGAGFLALQGLAMTGVISINWKKIEEQVTKKLDFDGDGKLTVGDFKLVGLRFVHNLSRDLPSAGSFSAAFFLGFRYG